ncbi:MAG: LamG-like jellyroll fold domain-containing protein, partial [Pirellulaceae bacterium]
ASGGNDFGIGSAHDIHNYPGPEAPPAEDHRAAVLGEYGGLGLPITGHTWQDEANWGYRSFETREQLEQAYLGFIDQLRPLVESRLAAAVYTQTSDVEVEVNGLMTYDREVIKFDLERLARAHARLYEPPRPLSRAERSAAATIAYWRFEEGQAGEPVAHDRDDRESIAARDSSSHDNHLYAFAEGNAPLHSDDVPSDVIPLTGEPNRGSLDDSRAAGSATRDLYTDPGRSGTHMDVINTFPLTEWTLEFSVRPVQQANELGTLIGEDGHPVSNLEEAPLQVMLDREGHLEVAVIDATQRVRRARSREPLMEGQWHHLVIRCDGRELTVDRIVSGRAVSVARSDFEGHIVLHPGTWTIGRGFHGDRIGRDAQAWLDEIRVSSRRLDDDLLLWWKE